MNERKLIHLYDIEECFVEATKKLAEFEKKKECLLSEQQTIHELYYKLVLQIAMLNKAGDNAEDDIKKIVEDGAKSLKSAIYIESDSVSESICKIHNLKKLITEFQIKSTDISLEASKFREKHSDVIIELEQIESIIFQIMKLREELETVKHEIHQNISTFKKQDFLNFLKHIG